MVESNDTRSTERPDSEGTTMTRTRALRAAAAAVAAVASLALVAPAYAESVTVKDGADASGSLNDILDVTADHRGAKLVVTVSVADLRPTSEGGPASMALYVDTDPSRRGPEFRLGTGLQSGTDFQLVRMSGWKVTGDPLTCRHRVALDNAGDEVRFTIARPCLRRPDQVRIGVKMVDQFDGSHPITDWLKHRRAFTRWLDRA